MVLRPHRHTPRWDGRCTKEGSDQSENNVHWQEGRHRVTWPHWEEGADDSQQQTGASGRSWFFGVRKDSWSDFDFQSKTSCEDAWRKKSWENVHHSFPEPEMSSPNACFVDPPLQNPHLLSLQWYSSHWSLKFEAINRLSESLQINLSLRVCRWAVLKEIWRF